MHSAEKLNLNRGGGGRGWGGAPLGVDPACRGCGTCHDRLDVIGEIDWPRLTSWINIGRERKGGRLPRFKAVNWPRRIYNAMVFHRSSLPFRSCLPSREFCFFDGFFFGNARINSGVLFFFFIDFATDSSDLIKVYLRSKLVHYYIRIIDENFSVFNISLRVGKLRIFEQSCFKRNIICYPQLLQFRTITLN